MSSPDCFRLLLILVFQGCFFPVYAQSRPELERQISELERQISDQPPGSFDWRLHNELRHLYSMTDMRKSMLQCDIILRNSFMDGYILQVLRGHATDPKEIILQLSATGRKYPDFADLSAACWIHAAQYSSGADRDQFLRRALSLPEISHRYRQLADELLRSDPPKRRIWRPLKAPEGQEKVPGPWQDPADDTIWPNTISRANSDRWLVEHHDQIRRMHPRLLLINFSNEHSRESLDRLCRQIIQAIAESTRYHGYRNPNAPAFLQYQIFRFVDLRDHDRITGDSRLTPVKNPVATSGFNMDYGQYFSERFAEFYGVPDPETPGRFLRLDELVDGGYVHEVWFFGSGAKERPLINAYEVVEEKPVYDEQFRADIRNFVQAGNGGDNQQPWTGRSVRLGYINASRGPGCFLESLSHAIEAMSKSLAIPYFTRYFRDYAGLNLRERYGVPFQSLYELDYSGTPVSYPDSSTLLVRHQGRVHRLANYRCAGGNVHFPPNARAHYDLHNDQPVLSTIEDWRIGSGLNGEDIAKPFSTAVFQNSRDQASDCMGPWLVYWRQNMPGLENRQKDEHGRPMKNWWPFLFY